MKVFIICGAPSKGIIKYKMDISLSGVDSFEHRRLLRSSRYHYSILFFANLCKSKVIQKSRDALNGRVYKKSKEQSCGDGVFKQF